MPACRTCPLIAWLRAVQHNAAPATPPKHPRSLQSSSSSSSSLSLRVWNIFHRHKSTYLKKKKKTGPSYVAESVKPVQPILWVTAKGMNERETQRQREGGREGRASFSRLLCSRGKNLRLAMKMNVVSGRSDSNPIRKLIGCKCSLLCAITVLLSATIV